MLNATSYSETVSMLAPKKNNLSHIFCTSVFVWISISYSSLNLICVFTGSVESVESGLTIENNSGYNKNNQNEVGMLPLGPNKISSRNHIFNAKTVIRPEDCDVCEKR